MREMYILHSCLAGSILLAAMPDLAKTRSKPVESSKPNTKSRSPMPNW